jgi:hypothetical protein
MHFMRFQFSLATLLVCMTFVAICLGSIGFMRVVWKEASTSFVLQVLIFYSPYWIPFVFIAYAVSFGALKPATHRRFQNQPGVG